MTETMLWAKNRKSFQVRVSEDETAIVLPETVCMVCTADTNHDCAIVVCPTVIVTKKGAFNNIIDGSGFQIAKAKVNPDWIYLISIDQAHNEI